MSQSAQNINVIVIVSGQETNVKINVHQKVENLVREALHNTGNEGQAISEWELRTADGALIETSLRITDAGIVEGMRLYLSPRAGAGGST